MTETLKSKASVKPASKPKRRNWILRAALVLTLALVVTTLGWCRWVYVQIERYAALDQAAQVAHAAQPSPVDAIVVFGAAEYDGHPSPVYRARLDHGLTLYHHGIAPLLITLGGNGGDQYNEGAVGREYLMGMGVSPQAIIAETVSRNTEESARRGWSSSATEHICFASMKSAPLRAWTCSPRRGPTLPSRARRE